MAVDYSTVDANVHPIFGTDWKEKQASADESTNNAYDLLDKGILSSGALTKYILETSVYPREHKALKGLREASAHHAWHVMSTGGDEGAFLGLLMKLINAKNTIELGVFTGYSLLCTALALPDDGKVIAIDMNKDSYNIGAPYFEEAGVAHKIDFREGNCLEILKTLLSEEKNHEFFDFIFVDCDKENYVNYHPLLLQLVKMGGVIGYDNTLWGGSVADDDEKPMPDVIRYYKPIIQDLNKFLAKDNRIEISQLSIADGLTLCRRIV